MARVGRRYPAVFGESGDSRRQKVELGFPDLNDVTVPVRAMRSGLVISAMELPTGFAVSVQHDDSTITHYGHLSAMFVAPRVSSCGSNQRVAAGAHLGNAARSPVHCRFEVWERRDGVFVTMDPLRLLDLAVFAANQGAEA